MAPPFSRSLAYTTRAEPFEVTTGDGVALRGHRVGEGSIGLVFCHGFLGWHRKPRLVRFQEELAREFSVYAFDFRGHGLSGGESSYGSREHLDVEAVVKAVRNDGFERVVTLGGSMGGIAVIRHAAEMKSVEAVVAISTPALWDGQDSDPVRRIIWFLGSPSGRRLLRLSGVRIAPAWEISAPPVDVVADVSPIPLLIVHGRDDHFFDEEQAWLLYRNARPPKRLLLGGPFGHAEDGYKPAFARQLASAIQKALA